MSHYAILRVQKLKSAVAVHRSMKHAFRDQDTPNADSERTPDNTHFGAESVAEGMAAFKSRLPEKYRKDAVLAIEYLITGSPEAMRAKPRERQDEYFSDALQWLQKKHGAENVVYAGIHRDETTPHMYAYVVPRVAEKLNCRQFLGGAKALSELQTDFAKQVAMRHTLSRGIEGSRARHTTMQQHYAAMRESVPRRPFLEVPAPSMGERLNPRAYGERVAQSVAKQFEPGWSTLEGQARTAGMAQKEARDARSLVERQAQRLQPLVEAMRPVRDVDLRDFADVAKEMAATFAADRAKKRHEKQEEQEKTRRQKEKEQRAREPQQERDTGRSR